jgi:membrane dipeptidase
MTVMPTPAETIHAGLFTVDSHCDTPSSLALKGYDIGVRHAARTLLGGDIDLARMREGGLAAVFFAVYVAQGPRTPEGFAQARRAALATLDRLDRMFRHYPAQCELALSPADAMRIHAAGQRAIFLGMENGYPLGLDLGLLELYHRRGIRYLTLCHARDNDLCASCTSDQGDSGLSAFGAQVVARMNELGMMVDVSHASERTVEAVLRLSRAPVVASHSGARAVADHPRNLTDGQLRAIAAQGGVVQVCFVPEFLRPVPPDPAADQAWSGLWQRAKAHYGAHPIGEDLRLDAAFEAEHAGLLRRFPLAEASIKDVADHLDHAVALAGIDHVGIGSDFDGGGRLEDCRDVSELPALTAELLRRGYAVPDLRKIWGGNLMRVFGEVLDLALGE